MIIDLPGTDDDEAIVRDRTRRLFEFVASLYELRNPVPTTISSWQLSVRDIPEHESVELYTASIESDEHVLLRCARSQHTQRPIAPEVLDDWLGRDWLDFAADPKPLDSKNVLNDDGSTEVVYFEAGLARLEALASYRQTWDQWAAGERKTSRALKLFEALYSLHATLEREGERVELGVADGTLIWRRAEGVIRYPLLFRSTRLVLDASIPEIRIVDLNEPIQFNEAIFRKMEDVEGSTIARLRAELAKDLKNPHPLAESTCRPFLRSVATSLSSRGDVTDDPALPATDDPKILISPLFFLRPRTGGFSRAIDAVKDDVLAGGEIPVALRNIVGMWPESAAGEASSGQNGSVSSSVSANEDSDILFTKPANAEQLEIARLLKRNAGILVQGPPGTGKTHTISNLLGHLLAEGKTVLVVSQTTKALRVLGDKVVETLRPLCVSILDNVEDDKRLKASVEAIALKSSSVDRSVLEAEAEGFVTQRGAILEEIRTLRSAILDARHAEIRPIVLGGTSISPLDAAKAIAAGHLADSWIPTPVKAGAALALTPDEMLALYQSNVAVTEEAERAVTEAPLPNPSALVHPEEFERILSEQRSLDELDLTVGDHLWRTIDDDSSMDDVLQNVEATTRKLQEREAWTRRVTADGANPLTRSTWETLVAEIEACCTRANEELEHNLAHQPKLAADIDAQDAATIYRAISNDVNRTGRLPSPLQLLARRDWKRALDGCTVNGRARPTHVAHFSALAGLAELGLLRTQLVRRWNTQVVAIGGPTPEPDKLDSEEYFQRYVPLIRVSLGWLDAWAQTVALLEKNGFDYESFKLYTDTRFAGDGELGRISKLATELPTILGAEYGRRRSCAIRNRLQAMDANAKTWPTSPTVTTLQSALLGRRPAEYRNSYAKMAELQAMVDPARARLALLERLEGPAFAWAHEIRLRRDVHGRSQPPGDAVVAWRWIQLAGELDRRNSVSLPDLMFRLERCRKRLDDVTADLADRRAWAAQARRTTAPQRAALQTFALATKKRGRGTGKHAAAFEAEARQALTNASSAVPVWIMPVIKAAEMFDPKRIKFDVVIVDEASQSDITGLLPLYLGRQVLVVGDDEQVSPLAVGVDSDAVKQLIAMFIPDIPSSRLFDLKSSLYDLSNVFFSAKTRLLEHFRCVPEIIRFSNELSYHGEIRPLREATPDCPTPAVIAHRVESQGSMDKVNRDEAKMTAALVIACTEQLEYTDKTFGIISMKGDFQGPLIESYIRQNLSVDEIERRHLLVGNPAQFQGDERHVMFLSMVDASKDGTYAISQTDPIRQRYNVAASRAQDQMWVVYSLDPANDLKTGDLRRRLIEFALDPDALELNKEAALRRSESPFETAVIQRLSAAGYRVTAQHRVGAYRIDMVVEGESQRLAVECDGEQFHQDIQRDVERQAILERVGWTFERIRGSVFYRDADRAMRPIFERLERMNIQPRSGEPTKESSSSSDLVTRVRARAMEIVTTLDIKPERWQSLVSVKQSKAIAEAIQSQADREKNLDEIEYIDPASSLGDNYVDRREVRTAASSRYFDAPLPTIAELQAVIKKLMRSNKFPSNRDDQFYVLRSRLIGNDKLLKGADKIKLVQRMHQAIALISGSSS